MNENAEPYIALVIIVIAVFFYILPSIIAFGTHHPNRWIILALNVFFGGTVVVWFVCLIWACRKVHDPQLKTDINSPGGESGLNLFINDVKSVRMLKEIDPNNQLNSSNQNISFQIEKAFQLKKKGVLTEEEFQAQKTKLLNSGELSVNTPTLIEKNKQLSTTIACLLLLIGIPIALILGCALAALFRSIK